MNMFFICFLFDNIGACLHLLKTEFLRGTEFNYIKLN